MKKREPDPLFLSKKKAAEYLKCSVEELKRWVKPDRQLDSLAAPSDRRGMKLWSRETLNSAKPHIEAWREKDRISAARWQKENAKGAAAASARRKGMRKNGALLTSKVCSALGCTTTELNRWANDGRMPPDGAIYLPPHGDVRCWLPATIEVAQRHLTEWRKKDSIARIARRRWPKIVR
jgi:hypothetical protein